MMHLLRLATICQTLLLHSTWKPDVFTCFLASSMGERIVEVRACGVQLVFEKHVFDHNILPTCFACYFLGETAARVCYGILGRRCYKWFVVSGGDGSTFGLLRRQILVTGGERLRS